MSGRLFVRALCTLGVVFGVCAGCVEPAIISCPDGRVCPTGLVCTPVGCSLSGCGDGDVDLFAGEHCDAGNQRGGDGCSPTCQIESCGDGFVDVRAGEECDDKNFLSHDGCSSTCLIESLRWITVATTRAPTPRAFTAAVWVPDRGHVFLQGGQTGGGSVSDEVWRFDGDWHAEPPGPRAVSHHGMAWDGSGRIVLFGGQRTGLVDECWVWEAGVWSECSPGPRPPARRQPAITTALEGGVLVAGGDGSAPDDVWRWRDGAWSLLPLAKTPRSSALALATEPRNARVIATSLEAETVFTWQLRDETWSAIEATMSRYGAPVVYDPNRGRLVVVGGADLSGLDHAEVYELDDERWTQRPVVGAISPRSQHIGVYDALRRGLLVFGDAGRTDGATYLLRWDSATPDEVCTDPAMDRDGDALAGCADPDCWPYCDPQCPYGETSCAAGRPRCGDGACNLYLEMTTCPEDCP